MRSNEKEGLRVSQLRCEALDAPVLVDTGAPRFSWRLESALRGVCQAAYQLRLAESGPDGRLIGESRESDRVNSNQSQWVEFPRFTAKAKTRYQWQVRIWDSQGRDSGWSPAAKFETSLLGSPWRADWVSDGKPVARDVVSPARYFRKTFTLSQAPVRAKLYLSAFGLVDPWLNAARVTEDLFLPGWPDYTKRNFYVAYDVTSRLQVGANVLGLILADGWFSSTLMLGFQFGAQPSVSGWIEITDAMGETSIVATDGSWQVAEGPITASGIYPGERFDARKADEKWSAPASTAWNWQRVNVETKPVVELQARYSQAVRRIEEIAPISRREVSPGVFLYDLGQNMVGWARLKLKAACGQMIELRFAEMLEPDDSPHNNLRTAKATATYTARGEGVEEWEPSFTFFGFRYVLLSGIEAPLADAITGVVLHSALSRIGHFECSNPLLNQLYSNTLWGQKGNFLEVPTDCPQRDERLGWTGDAQVFCHTAHYNLASGPFYRQWLGALRDSFADGIVPEPGAIFTGDFASADPAEGGYGSMAPHTGLRRGAAGWADAGVIVPWVTWLHTGDRRVLEENFGTIQRWIALLDTSAPEGIRLGRSSYGDWLAPGYSEEKAPTPYVLIATAYFAYSTQLAARMSAILDRPEQAEKYRALFERIKAAFRNEFISDDGKITSDEQTAYLLALSFDLVPSELRAKVIGRLERAIAVKNNQLSTGFLGTPLLAPVLSEIGRTDLAYSVVLQESYPGWLFSVKNGATTIWERWDSWTPENGFHKSGMNSFNHYAYGSVIGWFYDTIAGIKPLADAPGWKKFAIAPSPGGGLTQAKASLETPYGLVVSAWQILEGRFELDVTVPANTSAEVSLPATTLLAVRESGKSLTEAHEVSVLRFENGRVNFQLASGSYHFSAPL